MEIQHTENILAVTLPKKPKKNLKETDRVMCCPVLNK